MLFKDNKMEGEKQSDHTPGPLKCTDYIHTHTIQVKGTVEPRLIQESVQYAGCMCITFGCASQNGTSSLVL